MNLIFIKLGGSIITDKRKPYTARMDVIKRLAKEIHEAKKKSKNKIIVGHGGGSFPHISASKYKTNEGMINENSVRGISIVGNDAAILNRIVVQEFINAGENAITIQPSAAAIAKNGKIIRWDITPIKEILKYDLLPVVYGDVCMDIKKGCCIISTEEIFDYLSKKLIPKKIIMVGETDGVYDDKGKTINLITNSNFKKIKKFLSGSGGVADVTGGMVHKIEKSLSFTRLSIMTIIINGNRKGMLKRALLGKKIIGTIVK
jgi:isopentenyl phosphate kinase